MLGIYRLVEVFHPVLLPLLETVWQVVRGGRYDHRCVFEQWVGKVQDSDSTLHTMFVTVFIKPFNFQPFFLGVRNTFANRGDI